MTCGIINRITVMKLNLDSVRSKSCGIKRSVENSPSCSIQSLATAKIRSNYMSLKINKSCWIIRGIPVSASSRNDESLRRNGNCNISSSSIWT
jgi:hypothetical protein